MEEKKKKKMIALVIAGVALIGGVSVGTVIWANGSNKENKTTETRKVDLLETVEGLEDKLYVEVNTQGTNFLKGITYDKATIEKVLVDTSKVNYDKEGTYEIVYTFFPVDSKMDSVEKKVQIEVVSHERAEELKKEGLWFVCADMDGTTMYQLDLKGPIGLVIGSEGDGVGRLVKEKCDFVASIPMKGDIDSLNASVAAGVLAYEIVRQRLV